MSPSGEDDTLVAFGDVEGVQEGTLALPCRVRGKTVSIPRTKAVRASSRDSPGTLVIPRSLARERGLIWPRRAASTPH